MKKVWVCLIFTFVLFSFNKIQERTISGTVISAEDRNPIPGANIIIKGTTIGASTDANGRYQITVPAHHNKLVFSFIGYQSQEISIGVKSTIDVVMEVDAAALNEVVITGYGIAQKKSITGAVGTVRDGLKGKVPGVAIRGFSSTHTWAEPEHQPARYNTEEYATIEENIFLETLKSPLSTFSIDVDAASYSNIRRFISNGERPPKDAVRIEEMINYFDYDYGQPTDEHPCAVHTEISSAPWNAKHQLVHIGLQGKKIPTDNLPASNLVFLIDVSGSMDAPNKLPLVKNSFKMLVEQLREQDHVAIVVYAGAAGTVLEPTSGTNKKSILAAIDQLTAGGSTAGGEGLKLAYALAKQHFKTGGNNRIVLTTDGDFNVGEASNAALEKLIEQKRKEGIFLTVLGYGMGNYKDSKMEILADKGNGNYAYIDNISEARKVLVNEFGGTLFTIAKDVKLQIEFNPAKVKAYRLIGYENRMLKSEDFNNDKKDAGELGSGHSVTALYEIIPVSVDSDFFNIDELKYQSSKTNTTPTTTNELMTIKLRYKNPDEDFSKKIVKPVLDNSIPINNTSNNYRWSASVAAFGMLLRESEHVHDLTYDQVSELAQGARGDDKEGYRIEFINMVRSFGMVAKK